MGLASVLGVYRECPGEERLSVVRSASSFVVFLTGGIAYWFPDLRFFLVTTLWQSRGF